jgi:succinoglycan biosynthesis transport protein ExoP
MELQLYLDILKRRALFIALVAALAMTVVTTVGIFSQPVYTARTTMRVLLEVGITDFRVPEGYNERLLNTFCQVLESGPILEEAINRLLPRTASLTVVGLREEVEAEIIPDTDLISIAVQDGDPALARDMADMLATLLVEYARNLYVGSGESARQVVEEQLASLENQLESDRQQLAMLLASDALSTEAEALKSKIQSEEDAYDRLLERYELARMNEALRANSITVVAPASLPQTPSNALGLREVGLSLIVGLFSGVGLALVMENLDTRIHSSQQLEQLANLPVLGMVPKGVLSWGSSDWSSNGTGSKALEEAYRLLSINLQALREDVPLQTILITSAIPREGKSMVAANLAQTLAERGQTVFLVESDMRRPSMEKMFGIDNGLGLSSLLAERTLINGAVLGQVMHPAETPSLFVIGGGPEVPNPTALLASPSMKKLLDYLGTQGQTTLLDAPPVLGMADVSVLASKVDGVILIVNQALSRREHVREALKQLQASRAHVLGLVFLKKNSKGWGYGSR